MTSDRVAHPIPETAYAVFGNPIKHSKSPAIHAAFADQCGDDITYRAVRVEIDEFELKVTRFFERGGGGLNITLPFKERAFQLADESSDRANQARAANCLIPLPGGKLRADNTDGVGMIRDMVANHGWQLSGRQVLVLGAGGAARGVMHPLLMENPAQVIVANRTAERAQALAAQFSGHKVPVSGGGFESLQGQTFDLIINGTSASLDNEMVALPEITLTERCCCYDMMYGAEPTAFMRWAASKTPWAVSDGLGMLVEQAAESYFLWLGKRPDTRRVIQALRLQLSL